ncbi:MAG TPA: DivIVA domain-containing protein [Acidimicrobiales bacterium]
MELTPQTLHAVEFREARRGGYNTRDVDDFIERVADGLGHLNERVREAQARADAADARLAEAQRELDDARRRPVQAPLPPVAEASETDETLRRTLVLAQRTADATIKEAKEEANRVLSEAREEAARTRAEAEAQARRGADSARVSAQQEVETLLANRDALKGDLDVLTRRIDEQRNQLRSGITEMQRLLDDPTALKPLPPVTLAEVERPAPLEPADLAVDAGEPAGHEGTNGRAPAELGAPFAPGAQLAAMQEPPAPPVDLGPPTQPTPFAVPGDGRAPWLPSELRSPSDEPLGPPPAPQPAGDGIPTDGPVTADPNSRPSEWGKAVFEPGAVEGDNNRFGRRR